MRNKSKSISEDFDVISVIRTRILTSFQHDR